jgi:selenocysteine lyase/cysteine desulfurase
MPGVRLLGPDLDTETLPIATFLVEGVPHALLAARLSAEFAIGVRHGCFCAHPYLVRLLGLSGGDLEQFRAAARHHDRSSLPGAVRASCGISTTAADVERLLAAVASIAAGPPPVTYVADPLTGDYWPEGHARPDAGLGNPAGCSPG